MLLTQLPFKGCKLCHTSRNLFVPRCRACEQELTPEQVKHWANQRFTEEVDPTKPDTDVSLARASVLIALEEEAAVADVHAREAPDLLAQLVQREVRARGTQDQRKWLKTSGIVEAPTLVDLGSPASWSLSRLDKIGSDVLAAFCRLCGCSDNSNPAASTADHDRQASGAQASTSQDQQLPNPADFPMLAISAVNEVLFDFHGYSRMSSHGDPRDTRLPQVLERGRGAPTALCIVYKEICRRIGLPMAAGLLDSGQYCVLWPTLKPLTLSTGEALVVDVYSGGSLYLQEEIRQTFELPAGPLKAATTRELLCALCGTIRDVHWAKALGCPPEPGLMTPISISTIVYEGVRQLEGYQAQRAMAAARRTLELCPEDRSVREKCAVVLYNCGRYEEAIAVLLESDDEDLLTWAEFFRHVEDPTETMADQ